MIFSIIIGVIIFGYAIWTLIRFIKKSKQGQCAGCSLNKTCQSGCSTVSPETRQEMLQNLEQKPIHR
ncbi:radical SAM protein with 4Fe4S-binding SPASM domain [Scopulibacillus darangshiensis]|uniref:Radical SAM protein with 4Fe4S-binding SPASM domain n=1 Tax=Scopulibacillus darangshiensis TaxID=442528 RepID=A0A4R2P4R5_9BACL|nr:FeoB-associated Cys-rich membrane protein [Scopulibacillus darangshiensis]TCP28941.1 radical SAM protein with 4Fe4S-binding SPASM domain [Scopulibacillus darangshiensis]